MLSSCDVTKGTDWSTRFLSTPMCWVASFPTLTASICLCPFKVCSINKKAMVPDESWVFFKMQIALPDVDDEDERGPTLSCANNCKSKSQLNPEMWCGLQARLFSLFSLSRKWRYFTWTGWLRRQVCVFFNLSNCKGSGPVMKVHQFKSTKLIQTCCMKTTTSQP